MWEEDGTVGIKGPDGKFLSNKQTGILYSTGKTLEDTNKFKLVIVNRPSLVLKSEFGFVGSGFKGSQFVCNKAKYDILKVTPDGNGSYTIQGEIAVVKSHNLFSLYKKNEDDFSNNLSYNM